MNKTLPISEVKARLPELVTGIAEREEEVVITRNGKPAAMLVSFVEYQRLKETLDVLCDPDLMKQITLSRTYFKRYRHGLSHEDVFGEPIIPKRRHVRRA